VSHTLVELIVGLVWIAGKQELGKSVAAGVWQVFLVLTANGFFSVKRGWPRVILRIGDG